MDEQRRVYGTWRKAVICGLDVTTGMVSFVGPDDAWAQARVSKETAKRLFKAAHGTQKRLPRGLTPAARTGVVLCDQVRLWHDDWDGWMVGKPAAALRRDDAERGLGRARRRRRKRRVR